MTLREWMLDPDTLALVGPDDVDRRCRWHWYLIDHIDLHMDGTTLELHQAALRRLERKNED